MAQSAAIVVLLCTLGGRVQCAPATSITDTAGVAAAGSVSVSIELF